MSELPRVAFFTDSYHELNGVALTSRRFENYAGTLGLPFMCVRAGESTSIKQKGCLTELELKRGPISFAIDRRQRHDLALWRHRGLVAEAFKSFKPDVVHITGPSDVGQLGAYVAHTMRVPLVASWHTDLHKFGAQRLDNLLSLIPQRPRKRIVSLVERRCLDALIRFYKIPRLILAPNKELVQLLNERTRKPVHLMRRGVDINLFAPSRRKRLTGEFIVGYVGRLTPEKNVRLLARLEAALIASGQTDYGFLIVGDGYERPWLEAHLKRARFTGMLTGDALATAYANMDLFVFPSHTDTFGNVVLEALASGTPAVVTSDGGPKYLVTHGLNGAVARNDRDFIDSTVALVASRDQLQAMSRKARVQACETSWEAVFAAVYRSYEHCLSERPAMELSSVYAG